MHWATTQTLVSLITPDNWNLPDLECWANQSDGRPGQSPDVSASLASLASPLYRHYLRRILFQSVRFMVGRCGARRREHRRLLRSASSWPLFRSSQFILGSTKRQRQRRGAPGSFRMIAIRTSIQYATSHVMRTAAKFATST